MLHAQGLRDLIGEPSICRYGLGTREYRKIEHESQSCCDRHFMSTFEVVPSAVTIGGGIVDGGRVIAEIIVGIINLVECV